MEKSPKGLALGVVIRQECPMPTSELARVVFSRGWARPFGRGGHMGDRRQESPEECEYLENLESNQADIRDSGKLMQGKDITLRAAIILHIRKSSLRYLIPEC